MIYLQLFLVFLKIGAVSFGGGYGMISVIRDECLSMGWLSESELMNFIAVAESTPGPIAVNMATFVGSAQAGAAGALLATLGVILPAFLIILLISAALKNLLKYGGVQAALGGVRPAIVGLILATGGIMLGNVLFGFSGVGDPFSLDFGSLAIFTALCALALLHRKFLKKPISPILLILISGALGVLLF